MMEWLSSETGRFTLAMAMGLGLLSIAALIVYVFAAWDDRRLAAKIEALRRQSPAQAGRAVEPRA